MLRCLCTILKQLTGLFFYFPKDYTFFFYFPQLLAGLITLTAVSDPYL